MDTVPGGLDDDWLLASKRSKTSSMAARRTSGVSPRICATEKRKRGDEVRVAIAHAQRSHRPTPDRQTHAQR